MKKYKIIDIAGSLILIFVFAMLVAITRNKNYLVAGYCIIAAWQLVSMITHFVNNWFFGKGSMRMVYHRFVIALACLAISGFFFPVIFYFLSRGLLFATPLFVLYYTGICYYELRVKMQRPIAVLK